MFVCPQVASVGSRTIALAVRGPIERADLPGLSDRVCTLFAAHPRCAVDCDVAGVPADAVTVEALARLQLVAKRHQCVVRLRNVTDELRELVALIGLEDVLPE